MKNIHGEGLKTLLGHNIRLFRLTSGFSQAELAEKAGISVPYLGAVERGDKWPSPTTLAEIARSLKQEPYDLLKPENSSSLEIRKIISKLTKDISALTNQSIKMLNNISSDLR